MSLASGALPAHQSLIGIMGGAKWALFRVREAIDAHEPAIDVSRGVRGFVYDALSGRRRDARRGADVEDG
jgi:hypothetical protein